MKMRKLTAMLLAASLMISQFALGEQIAETKSEPVQENTVFVETVETEPEAETDPVDTTNTTDDAESVKTAEITQTAETETPEEEESPEVSAEGMIYIFETGTAETVDEPTAEWEEAPTEEASEGFADYEEAFEQENPELPDEPEEDFAQAYGETLDKPADYSWEEFSETDNEPEQQPLETDSGIPCEPAEDFPEESSDTGIEREEQLQETDSGTPYEPTENVAEGPADTWNEPTEDNLLEADPDILTGPVEDYAEEFPGGSVSEEILTEGDHEEGPSGTSDPENTTDIAEISDLTVSPVDTSDVYSKMTFTFMANGREYTCLVTGLAEKGNNEDDAWKKLAEDIASSFLKGEIFTLSESGAAADYDLTLDLIDAEKINHYAGGEDSLICWAASASDMLEYTGWNKQEDEDAAYAEYRDAFYNRGGTQEMGISWYLDGVNTHHSTYSASSGDAIVRGKDSPNAAAQQKEAGSGGYWTEYAAASVTEEYDEEIPDKLDAAADLLEEGYGVGLGAYFYKNDTARSGHALTLFGYIRERLENAASALRALFVSDSDNRANGSQTDPANYPNEYTMYQISSFEAGGESLVELEGYDASYTTAVGRVTALAPQETSEKETEGTANPLQSPNLTPSVLRVEDEEGVYVSEAESGSTVTVGTEIRNQSYKGIPGGSVIRYAVDIYVDGELVDTVEKEITAEEKIRSNGTVSASAEITLDRSGEYTFTTRILDVTDADGKAIGEAYLTDNTWSGSAKLTVLKEEPDTPENPGEPDLPETPEEPEEIIVSAGESGEKPEQKAEIIYTLEVVLATDTEYLLNFDASAAAPESFTRLRNRKTGDTVDLENYTIVRREGGGFTISFGEHFIRTLKPGRNDFALSWKTGRVLLRIIII